MTKRVGKVYAYITHGHRLALFTQPAMLEASGIQVPGGTVEPNESLEAAVMREAYEETGLDDLELAAFLGECDFDTQPFGGKEIYRRSFFHLVCTGEPPEVWDHYETSPSDGSPDPILFSFFWATLPDGVPELRTDMGALLSKIVLPEEP